MSSKLVVTLSVPSGGQASWQFVGDGYGYDAVMAMFTAADCTENVHLTEDETDRLAFETTVRIARDRLACYGFGRARSLVVASLGLVEPTDFGHAPRLRQGEDLSNRIDAWALSLSDAVGTPNDAAARGEELLVQLMRGAFGPSGVFPMLHGLALALGALPGDATIQVDLSASDWVFERSEDEVFMRDFIPLELMTLAAASVLCEGVFDSRVIEFAIARTHPHLVDHLAVAKFDFNREGSSSALARLVRGLADVRATGPRGLDEAPRIVAIFDADRAGALEAARLGRDGLPTNFTVLTLPGRAELESYPVLGPNGIEKHDVNGWGAAIETYLAIELDVEAPLVLAYDRGAVGGYQGTLLNEGKAAVQQAFERSVEQQRSWPVLEFIVQHIVHGHGL